MSNMIQSTSVSYEAIRNDLKNYVQSIGDYQRRWKDFYEGGAGTTTIELVAGFGAYLGYMARANRREAYIDTARLRSSILNLSTTLGYNVNRRSSPRYSITMIVPNDIYWERSIPIGTYGGQSLSLLSNMLLIAVS